MPRFLAESALESLFLTAANPHQRQENQISAIRKTTVFDFNSLYYLEYLHPGWEKPTE
ncbi:MAG: hypothetical protein AAF892_13820 [Cyanobacteria bacterium P01_D01_bin.71]